MGLKYIAVDVSGFPFSFVNYFIPFGYSTCIETGTYCGYTAQKLSQIFSVVHTIEASDKFYELASNNLKKFQNVYCHHGDSRIMLPEILNNHMEGGVIFYLDAHYSSEETYFNNSPLMQELHCINLLSKDAIVIVDDARFINMKYNNEKRYAGFYDFIITLHNKNRYISCFDDKYFAVPEINPFIEHLDLYTQTQSKIDDTSLNIHNNIIFRLVRKALSVFKKLLAKVSCRTRIPQ
jgi:hypothetical protein